jgi:hypothetical protein
VCSAGLLYMPVARALSEWHRLLKTNGVVAFSTMKAGSPSAGRIFRECAAGFGLDLKDPSQALGTEDQCRAALRAAGFERLRVTAGRVDFEGFDPALAWEANCRAHGVADVLTAEQQDALQRQYLDALAQAQQTDVTAARRADVLFAIGYRAER